MRWFDLWGSSVIEGDASAIPYPTEEGTWKGPDDGCQLAETAAPDDIVRSLRRTWWYLEDLLDAGPDPTNTFEAPAGTHRVAICGLRGGDGTQTEGTSHSRAITRR